jgi:hypothetical protein
LTSQHLLWFSRYNCQLTRFDYCIDIKNKTPEQMATTIYNSRRPNQLYTKKQLIETLYYGEYSIKTNRTLLIRFYEKKIEIQKRDKIDIYPDYLKYSNVTRLEFEVRNESIKNYRLTFYDLFNAEKLAQFMQSITNTRYLTFGRTFSKMSLEQVQRVSQDAAISYYQPRLVSIMRSMNRLRISDKQKMRIIHLAFEQSNLQK